MKLTKTCRKLNGYTAKAVAMVEQLAKAEIAGFISLSYTASFNHFPASLRVKCLFTDDQALQQAKMSGAEKLLQKWVHNQMFKVGFVLKDARQNVILVSELTNEAVSSN